MIRKIMKNFSVAVIVFLFASNAFAVEGTIFSFGAGLSSGGTLYGDENIRKINSLLKEDKTGRVYLGTVGNVNLRIGNGLTFFIGNDTSFDLLWKGSHHFNHIETSFYPGLKVYPGFGGLNFSCAYSSGTRWDFISLPSSDSEEDVIQTDSVSWGNGFRLGIEYDFSYDSNPFYPSAGFYYRLCPRGNYNWDNVFGVYVLANF